LCTSKIVNDPIFDLISHPTKFGQNFLFTTFKSRGILKATVKSFYSTKKERAFFIGVTAEGNHMIKALAGEFIQCLGTKERCIDAEFGEYLSSQGVNPCGLGSGGKGLAAITEEVVSQCFGHLGAAGVMGAKEKYLCFHAGQYIRFNGYIKLHFYIHMQI
jgi:hypothetical protein